MFIIGLTGGVATGKSTAAQFFAEEGAVIIDADRLAHACLEPDGACYKEVIEQFGDQIVRDGAIDRKALGAVVFRDDQQRRDLEKIIHPAVRRAMKEQLAAIRSQDAKARVVLDVPLLFETGLHRQVDRTVVVKASPEMQMQRAQEKWGVAEEEVLARIKAQVPLEEKIRLADFIIDNDGNLKQTKQQVSDIWQRLFPQERK